MLVLHFLYGPHLYLLGPHDIEILEAQIITNRSTDFFIFNLITINFLSKFVHLKVVEFYVDHLIYLVVLTNHRINFL